MPNPKITLSVDQSVLDAVTNLTAALNRCADMLPSIASAQNSVQQPDQATGVSAPLVAAPTMTAAVNTGAGVAMPPVNAAEPNVATQMPTNAVQMPATPAAPVMPTVASAPVTQQPMAMPTAPGIEITKEMLMRAGVELNNRGVNAMAVLMEFGVQGVNQLPKEQYSAFAARLRSLGANI